MHLFHEQGRLNGPSSRPHLFEPFSPLVREVNRYLCLRNYQTAALSEQTGVHKSTGTNRSNDRLLSPESTTLHLPPTKTSSTTSSTTKPPSHQVHRESPTTMQQPTPPNGSEPTSPAGTPDERPGIARTFSQMGIPHPERKPSVLRRVVRQTKLIATALVPSSPSKAQRQASLKKAAKDAATQRHETEMARIRTEALLTNDVSPDALRRLAKHEGVYLNPVLGRASRFHQDDYDLDERVVARVSPERLHTSGQYVFLGRDRRLYIGRNNLGRGAKPIPEESVEFSEFKEVARAYWQLCDRHPDQLHAHTMVLIPKGAKEEGGKERGAKLHSTNHFPRLLLYNTTPT
ncbi:hypothetical protein GGR50DRAFT_570646 [Xylaria sp. CBS 124048]|nr:hypothetical protein GGR50DRAFT_570646 [Xylaria sp. CBS 124048]